MKVGITGGAGFIGGHVADVLRDRGHDVLVFDHRGRGGMLGDVRDRTAVTELAAHVDGVIHLAAVLGTQETIANPLPAAETNILGGINVADACRQYDLPLVYAGVGNFQMRNTYSTTKTCIERIFEQYRDELGLRVVVVRPMNAYGERQAAAEPFAAGKVRKIAPAFICRALSGLPIEVYGNGSQISDMVYVGDVAGVFASAIEHAAAGKVPEHPIEVGPVESVTVRQVAEKVSELAGPVPIEYLPMRPGEMSAGVLSPSNVDAAKAYLGSLGVPGWFAHQVVRPLSNRVNADTATLAAVGVDPAGFVSLDEGMGRTVEWFRAAEGRTWRRP